MRVTVFPPKFPTYTNRSGDTFGCAISLEVALGSPALARGLQRGALAR